jgi:hypothetical protein
MGGCVGLMWVVGKEADDMNGSGHFLLCSSRERKGHGSENLPDMVKLGYHAALLVRQEFLNWLKQASFFRSHEYSCVYLEILEHNGLWSCRLSSN